MGWDEYGRAGSSWDYLPLLLAGRGVVGCPIPPPVGEKYFQTFANIVSRNLEAFSCQQASPELSCSVLVKGLI